MYTTLATLKQTLGIPSSETTDDALLTEAIAAAAAAINAECGRTFVGVVATRSYGAESIDGRLLILDADLLSTSLVTNGDGTTLAADAYRLWPRNLSPAWGLAAREGTRWVADGDDEITVAGTWGYSATPPGQVVTACQRLAAVIFQQRLAPLGVAQMGRADNANRFGAVAVSPELLADLQSLLRGLRRRST